MLSHDIANRQHKIYESLHRKHLQKAFIELKRLTDRLQEWNIDEELATIETSYRYMIQYMLDGVKDAAVFSVGSDGTDGPTDAAGGYCDGETMAVLRAKGIDVTAVLADNDAYHALKECNGLIITGPTGTNVNDLTVLLLRR